MIQFSAIYFVFLIVVGECFKIKIRELAESVSWISHIFLSSTKGKFIDSVSNNF